MPADNEQQAVRDTAIQSTARAENQRTRAIVLRYKFERTQRAPFRCECADRNCTEIVMLSLADYERIREHPRRFLLAAGHENAETDYERIIEAESGYAVIEKTGEAGELAEQIQP